MSQCDSFTWYDLHFRKKVKILLWMCFMREKMIIIYNVASFLLVSTKN